MIKILRVEWIKTKRTMLREVLILSPVIFSLYAFWQVSKRPLDDEIIKNVFLIRSLFFKFFLSLLVSFISSYIIGYEDIYGNNVYINNRTSKIYFCLGKILSSFIYMVWILMVMDLIYIFSLKFLYINFPYKILYFSSIMALLGILPVIVLHVFVTFKWGMGISGALGLVGTLLSAIVTAGLGSKIWFLFPWAIPSMLNLYCIVFLDNIKVTEELTELLTQYSPFQIYLSSSLNGIIASIVYFVIFLSIGLYWFKRWEGRSCCD